MAEPAPPDGQPAALPENDREGGVEGDAVPDAVAPVLRRRRKRRKGPPNAADLGDQAVLRGHPPGQDREPVVAGVEPAPPVLPEEPQCIPLVVKDEEFERLTHRQKYLWLYRRFSWWARRNVQMCPRADLTPLAEKPGVPELLIYAVKVFKDLDVSQKNAVLHHWAEAVQAPECIGRALDVLWPPVVTARDAHRNGT